MEITKKYIEESMKAIQSAMIQNHNQGQKLSGKLDACAYMLKQLETEEPKKDEQKQEKPMGKTKV